MSNNKYEALLPLYKDKQIPTRPNMTHIDSYESHRDDVWIERGEELVVVRRQRRNRCLHLMLGCLLAFLAVCLVVSRIDEVDLMVRKEMNQTPAVNRTVVTIDSTPVPPVIGSGPLRNCEDCPSQLRFDRANSDPTTFDFPYNADDGATALAKREGKIRYSADSEKTAQTIPCNPLADRCPFSDEHFGKNAPQHQEKRQPNGGGDCSILFFDSAAADCQDPPHKWWEVQAKHSLPDTSP